MNMVDLIEKKRDGGALNHSEIEFIIKGAAESSIPDYQLAAYLMAVCMGGMTNEETYDMTMCMVETGITLSFDDIAAPVCDKHSTGGVGDKTTLIILPVIAACGGYMAKMSGRGLGHTGGTIDKLESVPGFVTALSPEKFKTLVKENGAAVCRQMNNLVSADKKMYALRDVTGTAASVELIASSVMSKKIASGADIIVLDVKYGNGAFMKTLAQAERLGALMVDIGTRAGRRVKAHVSDMNAPLGFAIGNALEVHEAIRVMRGEEKGKLLDLCVCLCTDMLTLAGGERKENEMKVRQAIESGAAYEKFERLIAAQGGDLKKLPQASSIMREVKASECGRIVGINALAVGRAAAALGAGRTRLNETIDFGAGIILNIKCGDSVQKGDVLCTLYSSSEKKCYEADRILSEKFCEFV